MHRADSYQAPEPPVTKLGSVCFAGRKKKLLQRNLPLAVQNQILEP